MKKVADRLPILEETEPKSNFGSISKIGNDTKSEKMSLEKLVGKLRTASKNKFTIKSQFKKEFLAEFFGTMIFLTFSMASVAQFIFSGKKDFLTIPLSFGIGLTIAVIAVGKISGSHLNPAVSFSMFLLGRLPFFRFIVYTIAQTAGAFAGAFMVFLVYLNHINQYDEKPHSNAFKFDPGRSFVSNYSNNIGYYSMELAPIFATYPKDSIGQFSTFSNFFDQFLSTSLFIVAILAITDKKNTDIPHQIVAILIGFSLVAVGTSFGLRGFAVNPARDFGPRLFTLVAGWGTEPFLSHNYYFWIPIVGPMVGSVFGTILYSVFVMNQIGSSEADSENEASFNSDSYN